jgi:histone H3/H4
MLYSPESLRTVDAIMERARQELKFRALNLAKQDGRNLVTDDDVWKARRDIHIYQYTFVSQDGARASRE